MIVFLCFFCMPLHAKERMISLKECIDIALSNNTMILISAEDKKETVAKYRLAKSQSNIKINAEARTVQYNVPTTSGAAVYSTQNNTFGLFSGLTAWYNIFDKKADENNIVAQLSLDVTKINNQKIRDDIIFNVKKAYFDYLQARANLTLRKKVHDKYMEKLNLARILFQKGLRPILDVSRTEVGMASASIEYQRAVVEEKRTKMVLFSNLGVENTDIEILPKDIDVLPEMKYDSKELFNLSDIYSADIQSIRVQKKINKELIDLERASNYPTVNFMVSLGYENRYLFNFSLTENYYNNISRWEPAIYGMLSASLPLYSGGAIAARIDIAQANYNKTVYKERELVMNLQNMIIYNLSTLADLLKQIKMSELNIKNSRNQLLLAQKSYESGVISLLDLQDAEMSLLNAELGLIYARYQYLSTVAKLSNIVGLGEDVLCRK